jgi:hypothetical protein
LQFDHHGSQTVYDRRGFHPEIQELACRCFDHPAFSAETIGRLATWLGLEFPAAKDVYGVPLREVAARLRTCAERRTGNPPAADSTAALAEQTDPVTRAIALLLAAEREGKRLLIKALPALVGCSRAKLYRDQVFKATVKAMNAERRANIPKGSKDREGSVEAKYDPGEE